MPTCKECKSGHIRKSHIYKCSKCKNDICDTCAIRSKGSDYCLKCYEKVVKGGK